MFPSSQPARHPGQALSMNTQYLPTYDFTGGYHHAPAVGDPSAAAVWNSIYAPREDYPYSFPGSSPSTGQVSFSSVDVSGSTPATPAGGSFSPYNFIPGQEAYTCRRRATEPIRPAVPVGKTRTKDKYRVVYTDHQRQELEKEFQYNRYISMRRKSELSMSLNLSERQVKIWFQNRRAKERKINKKKLQHPQQASTTTPTPPALGGPTDIHITTSPSSNILSDSISGEY